MKGKKRLTLLVLGLLPLLAGCGPFGELGDSIVKDGIKELLKVVDPGWNNSWFVVHKVPEFDGLMGLLLGLAVTVGFWMAIFGLFKVLEGRGFMEGVTGIVMLIASASVPMGLFIISILGHAFYPPGMSFSELADKLGWIRLPTDLLTANTVITSIIFSVIIPHVNASLQLLSALWFGITMLGAIPSRNYKGLISAGAWLVGPIIMPWVFWWLVGNISASYPLTGNSAYDNSQVVVMNGQYLGSVTIAIGTIGFLVWLTVKTSVVVAEFRGDHFPENRNAQQRKRVSLADAAAIVAAGAVLTEEGEEPNEEKRKKSKPSSNKRRKSRGGSDESDLDGSEAGYPGQRLITGPVEPDWIDAEEIPSDDGSGGGSDSSDDRPTPISEDHNLQSVEEDMSEGTTSSDGKEPETEEGSNLPTEIGEEHNLQSVDDSSDDAEHTEFWLGTTLQGPDGSNIAIQESYPGEHEFLKPESNRDYYEYQEGGRTVRAYFSASSSGEMKNLLRRFHRYEDIPWRSLSLQEDHADDVRHEIEAAHHESSANFLKHHSEEWKGVFQRTKQEPERHVTVKGHLYRIVDEKRAPFVNASQRKVRFFDKRRNGGTFLLEYVGVIPRHWVKRFPNNGEFDTSEGGAA